MPPEPLHAAMDREHGEGSPLVSVIIPAYECASYIEGALRSVFAQSFTDYEVIVVNDGSPDTAELERVVRPHLGRIVYAAQANRGPGAARNTALRLARGSLVAFLDADDEWEPDYLAAQVGVLQADPTVDVVYPDAVLFGDPLDEGRRFMELAPSEGEVTFEALVRERCCVLLHATARREAIERAGMFDESDPLRGVEDFDLWLRVVKSGGRIDYHRRPLVRYRRRPGSGSSDPTAMCRRAQLVMDKAARTLSLTVEERRILQEARDRFAAGQRYHEGRRALLAGDFRTAVEWLSEANAELRSRKIALGILGLRLAPRLLLGAYRLLAGLRRGTSRAHRELALVSAWIAVDALDVLP
jgi:glycosyltransferase involved in cell wall biosynthesis